MRALALAATMGVVFVSAACSTHLRSADATRVVDLGHALSVTNPTWSGSPAYARPTLASFARAGYEAGHVEVGALPQRR